MSTRTSGEVLLERVMRGGIPDGAAAERSLRCVLSVLGERLTDDEAGTLGANLPEELARNLDQSEYDADFDAAEFCARVGRRERTSLGSAREHVDIVLRAIGETIDQELRARLFRALPVGIRERLHPVELGDPPPHSSRAHAPALSTLAHGRSGSRRPLSEASPPAGHANSVATNDEPHAETKFSSARGLTQERLGESLASGRPGPERKISETNDD